MTEQRQVDEVQRARRWLVLIPVALAIAGMWLSARYRSKDTLLNVSYSATEAFHRDLNAEFKRAAGPGLSIKVSHAGSIEQALLVCDGEQADVAVLAVASDIDRIAARGLVDAAWRSRFPHGSSPLYSTIVFLVRAGNPKRIAGWSDLARDEVVPLLPSPMVSGAGRWAYLAAWGDLQKSAGDQFAAQRGVEAIYANATVLELSAHAALARFLRGEGDVVITWENEALDTIQAEGAGKVEVVYPPRSIRAEPVVAVLDRSVEKRGTRADASAYLGFFFTAAGQEIAARHHLRPHVESASVKMPALPASFTLFTVEEAFGGWEQAERVHFAEGGTFERIYRYEKLRREKK